MTDRSANATLCVLEHPELDDPAPS